MKRAIRMVVCGLMCVALIFSAAACVDTSEIEERVANLEALVALLNSERDELSEERIAELEALIADLRTQLDEGSSEVIADVVAENIASTVAIQVESKRLTDESTSTGSGFFIAYGGYVITNNHVVTPKTGYTVTKITVHTFNGETDTAELIGTLKDIDVALLRTGFTTAKPVKLGAIPAQGSRVIAIGSPSGISLKFSATSGIVSAINRVESASSDDGVEYHQFCIQHDAAINPGNSGGALFNLAGEVVGINTMGLRSSGNTVYESLGFAINVLPVMEIQKGIERAIRDVSTYAIPSLGVFVTDSILDEISSYSYSGANVKVVERSGTTFSVGDVITHIDNVEITSRQQFYLEILSRNKGDTVTVKYVRNYYNRTAQVTL